MMFIYFIIGVSIVWGVSMIMLLYAFLTAEDHDEEQAWSNKENWIINKTKPEWVKKMN